MFNKGICNPSKYKKLIHLINILKIWLKNNKTKDFNEFFLEKY